MVKSIYYRPDYHRIFVKEIKDPISFAFRIFFLKPGSGPVTRLRALRGLANIPAALGKLPRPTLDNVNRPNSRIIVRIRDEFLRGLNLPTRIDFISWGFDILIIVMETDLYYWLIAWLGMKLKQSDWEEPGRLQPDPNIFAKE